MMKKLLDQETIKKIKPWFPEFNLEKVKISISPSNPVIILAKLLGAVGISPLPNRTIYIIPKYYKPETAWGLGLIVHECEHLRQQKEMGWLHWIIKYLVDRLFLIMKYLPEIVRSKNIYLHYHELPLESRPMAIEKEIQDFYKVQP